MKHRSFARPAPVVSNTASAKTSLVIATSLPSLSTRTRVLLSRRIINASRRTPDGFIHVGGRAG